MGEEKDETQKQETEDDEKVNKTHTKILRYSEYQQKPEPPIQGLTPIWVKG